MAIKKVGIASAQELANFDTVQRNPIGQTVHGPNGEQFIYLKGIASTAVGSAVTYDEAGVTALLTDDAVGPVAISMSANIVVTTFGWYCILAPCGVDALVVTATADNSLLGQETTDGCLGDGRDAGDQVYGMICREANATGSTALCTVQIYDYPHVDNIYGS
jgi:hypothetical protein